MNIKKLQSRTRLPKVKDSLDTAKNDLLDKFQGLQVNEESVYFPNGDITPEQAEEIIKILKDEGVEAHYDNDLGTVTISEQKEKKLLIDWENLEEGDTLTTNFDPESGLDGKVTISKEDGNLNVSVTNNDKTEKETWTPEDGYFHDWVLDLAMRVQDCDLTQLPDYQSAPEADVPAVTCLHEGYNYNISADDGAGKASFGLEVSPSGGIITTESYGNVPAVFGAELPKQGDIITMEALRELLQKVLKQLGVQTIVSDSIISDRNKYSYNKSTPRSRFTRWLAVRGKHVSDSGIIVMPYSDSISDKAKSYGLKVSQRGKLLEIF